MSADATSTDAAVDIAISATGVDLAFTPPTPVIIHVYHQADPTVDPLMIMDSPLPAPYSIHLSWAQACDPGLDGVDVAAFDATSKIWWCGVGDGTPSKDKIGVKVDGLTVTPSMIIRKDACLGGKEGNLHLDRVQLKCPNAVPVG